MSKVSISPMTQLLTKLIIILPLVLKTNNLYADKEIRSQNVATTAIMLQFYPKLVKQLLNAFYGILAITIDVSDLLTLDQNNKADSHLFNNSRNQWISESVLEWILGKSNPTSYTKILAVCDFEAYSNGLNFVFGQAHRGGRVCAIYLPRLRQEFYGLTSNVDLFQQRLTTEAVHELGHMFGLSHYETRSCVMHFSNSLRDRDFKDYTFCNKCKDFSLTQISKIHEALITG
jgi:predicted Zn-dependent protease